MICKINGQIVDCPNFLEILGPSIAIFFLVMIALIILGIVSQWIIYEKAGKPGWASIVPIYNFIVWLEIVNRPLWWIVLFFIPFVNVIAGIILLNDLSKAFGKSTGFTFGLIFLSVIFFPILAFGKSQYTKPARV